MQTIITTRKLAVHFKCSIDLVKIWCRAGIFPNTTLNHKYYIWIFKNNRFPYLKFDKAVEKYRRDNKLRAKRARIKRAREKKNKMINAFLKERLKYDRWDRYK